jgi:hypothetical protein
MAHTLIKRGSIRVSLVRLRMDILGNELFLTQLQKIFLLALALMIMTRHLSHFGNGSIN